MLRSLSCALVLLASGCSGGGSDTQPGSGGSGGAGGASSSESSTNAGGAGPSGGASSVSSTSTSTTDSSSSAQSSTGAGAGGAAPGHLDPSFGGARKIDETDSDWLDAMVETSSGKILFGGTNVVDPIVSGHPWLLRRTSSGGADTSFHGTGSWILDAPKLAGIYALANTPDGGVVGVGALDEGILVLRLTSAGELDPAFGQGGVVDLLPDTFLAGVAVAVESSGRILVVTNATTAGKPNVLGLTANGALDPTFGSGGQLTVGVTPTFTAETDGGAFYPSCVGVGPGGRILLGGSAFTGDGNHGLRFGALALDDTGSVDATYGQDGMDLSVVTYWGAEFYRSYDTTCALGHDGRLAVSGWSETDTDQLLPVVVSFRADGHLDTTFGNGGYTIVPPGNDWEGVVPAGVAVQADGKILVGGNFPTKKAGVTRLLANGALDSSYATPADAGWFLYPATDPPNDTTFSVTHVGVLADGRAVLTYSQVYSHNLLELDDAVILALTP